MPEKHRGKREAQAAMRRQLLLETALTLFSERGYRSTSVRDITRAAGVTEAVLYHYFANKADLLAAVLERYAPFAGYRGMIGEARGTGLTETMRSLSREFLHLLRQRRAFVLTLLSEAPTDPDLAQLLGNLLQGVIADISQFLSDRQQAGEVDPDLDTAAVAKALQGGLLMHFLTTALDPNHPEPDVRHDQIVADRIVQTIIDGVLPHDRQYGSSH